MDDRLIVALVALVAVASAGAALTSAGAVSASPLAGDADAGSQAPIADDGSNESNGTALGTEVSSFMASSSESTNGSVDRGLFDASYNDTNATERDDLVRNRTDELEARLAALREQKRQLTANKANMSDVAYKTRMSSLVTRIHELEAAINDTERKARETGVDTAQLERLRAATGNLSGPEIARIARNLSGVTPGPPPGAGPPDDAGPPGNDTGPPSGNDTGPPSGNDTGRPAGNDTGPPSGNDTGRPAGNDTGPPAGNESGSSSGGENGGAENGSDNGASGGDSGGGNGGGGGSGGSGGGAGDRPRLTEPTCAADLRR